MKLQKCANNFLELILHLKMCIFKKINIGKEIFAPTSSKAHNESTTGLIFLLLYRFRSLSITPLMRPPRFCLKSRFSRENPAITLFSSYSLIGFTFSTCHHWKGINSSRFRKTLFKNCTKKLTKKNVYADMIHDSSVSSEVTAKRSSEDLFNRQKSRQLLTDMQK